MSIAQPLCLGAFLLATASTGAWADPAREPESATNVPARAVVAGEQRVVSHRQLSAVTEVRPARFRATVYELEGNRADTLPADILARKAATSDSLFEALGGATNTRVLYQIDQAVNVFSEEIVVGSSQPVKLAARSDSDLPVNGVTYINVGLILRLSAQLPRPTDSGAKPDVFIQTQLSAVGGSQAVPASKPGAILAAKLNQIEPLEFGRARVMLSTNSNPATALTQPVTYVVRYVFDELHQKSGTALETSPGTNPNSADQQLSAQFEATAYEVMIPPEHLKALDSEALAREAGTAEKLLGRLNEIGEARITYAINQVVNVLSDQVTFSTNEWLTTGVRTVSGPAGPKQISSRTAQRVGLIVRLAGVWPTNGSVGPDVTLHIQSSGLGPTATPLTPDVKATRVYNRSITHSEALEFDKPRVMLSVISPDPSGEPGVATMSIFRYLFRPLQAPRSP